MKRIEFHPEAEQELVQTQGWYRERSEVVAQAFALEIDHAIRSIADAPECWPETDRGERRFVLPRFPYSILYRIRSDAVFITAVAQRNKIIHSSPHRRRSQYVAAGGCRFLLRTEEVID